MFDIAAGALAVSQPADACVRQEAPLSGAIVLVTRGACSFVEKAINVQAAGAIGIVVINHVNAQAAFAMGFDQQDLGVNLIAMMVSKEVGLELLDTVGQLEVHQQSYINIQAQAHNDVASQMTQEHHVVVPDATQRWLQSHKHLQKAATQGSSSPAWQSLLMDLAAPILSLERQTFQQTNTVMQGTPQHCVAPK